MKLLSGPGQGGVLRNGAGDGPYLRGWYPGFGEEWILRRLPQPLREFVADASLECPEFVEEYLLPTLGELDPVGRIASDLAGAVAAIECESYGLGDYDDLIDGSIGMGELGAMAGVLKKIKKAVKKVAHKVIAPIKKVAEKITPKPLLNIQKKFAHAVTGVNKKLEKVAEKTEHVAGQIGKKYGNQIILGAGIILAPFTGGASLAAASALAAANSAYQKKRAADQAKKLAKADAGKLADESKAADAALLAQVDGFYRDNQAWFEQRGITPSAWSGMSLQQKIDAINSGATGGAGAGAGSGGGSSGPGSYGGGSPDPSGGAPAGGGGGGGGDWSLPGGSGGGGGGGAQPGKKVATASMFGGGDMLLPALVIGAALAFGGGKSKGRSRARRNPRRRPARRVG